MMKWEIYRQSCLTDHLNRAVSAPPILGKPDNPLLPPTVNAVLLLKTNPEVAEPIDLSCDRPSP